MLFNASAYEQITGTDFLITQFHFGEIEGRRHADYVIRDKRQIHNLGNSTNATPKLANCILPKEIFGNSQTCMLCL